MCVICLGVYLVSEISRRSEPEIEVILYVRDLVMYVLLVLV